MRQRPEDQWNVTDAGVVVYYLFPNTQIVLFNRVISIFRIYPNRNEVGRSLTRMSHYSAQHIGLDFADEQTTKLDGASLYDADMSSRIEFNLETQMEIAFRLRYTSEDQDRDVQSKVVTLAKQLRALRSSLSK